MSVRVPTGCRRDLSNPVDAKTCRQRFSLVRRHRVVLLHVRASLGTPPCSQCLCGSGQGFLLYSKPDHATTTTMLGTYYYNSRSGLSSFSADTSFFHTSFPHSSQVSFLTKTEQSTDLSLPRVALFRAIWTSIPTPCR